MNPAIKVENITKTFSLKSHSDLFYALKNVSFSIDKGQSLGVVGLNGAGKSTLLKILLGYLTPNSGMVKTNGKLGGLIELGSGFHLEVSGYKNIFLQGQMHGFSNKAINEKINNIIEFADIGDFINAPVRTYSSGMSVRLGFAIAIFLVPDIIICDEILAVGDFEFRQKCLHSIKRLRGEKTFLLVSHSPRDISTFCDRAILLHQGELISIGEPKRILAEYSHCHRNMSADELRTQLAQLEADGAFEEKKPDTHWTSQKIKLTRDESSLKLRDPRNENVGELNDQEKIDLFGPDYINDSIVKNVKFHWNLLKNESGFYYISGDTLLCKIEFELLKELASLRIGLPIFDKDGKMILGADSRNYTESKKLRGTGPHEIFVVIDPLPLVEGTFWLTLALNDDPAHVYRQHLTKFQVYNPELHFGTAYCPSYWTTESIDSTLTLVN